MLLDKEYFNSGDKFLFTMTNLERTELFISKGLKGMTAFKKLEWEMIHSKTDPSKFIFDNALKDYLNNPKTINEFKMSRNYPSINAMQRAIETNEFQNQLGCELERLILACENMVCGNNGINENDCYRIPLMYIFNKIYKNDN